MLVEYDHTLLDFPAGVYYFAADLQEGRPESASRTSQKDSREGLKKHETSFTPL